MHMIHTSDYDTRPSLLFNHIITAPRDIVFIFAFCVGEIRDTDTDTYTNVRIVDLLYSELLLYVKFHS